MKYLLEKRFQIQKDKQIVRIIAINLMQSMLNEMYLKTNDNKAK